MKTNQKSNEKQLAVGISAVKLQQLNKQPIIETNVNVSDDGKWLIHRTIITDIKPVSYFEKVLDNA